MNLIESLKSDRLLLLFSIESIKNNDVGDSDVINNGGIFKFDFKYIDVESKENFLEDVWDIGKEEGIIEIGGEGNVIGDVNIGIVSEGEIVGKIMEMGRSNFYLEMDIDIVYKNGE